MLCAANRLTYNPRTMGRSAEDTDPAAVTVSVLSPPAGFVSDSLAMTERSAALAEHASRAAVANGKNRRIENRSERGSEAEYYTAELIASLRRHDRAGYIRTTMLPLPSPRFVPFLAALLFGAAGCGNQPGAPGKPPAAEFLVTAGDSAFWVTTIDGRLRVRRAPLTLAYVDGRFYELYVADDDRSYFDALLIGQRIYRRDLVSGDSVQVFEDRRVTGIARRYAAEHPDERRLDEDEAGSDDPHTVATSDVELLDVLGPLVSYAHQTDIDIANVEDSHTARYGVVDLRDGSAATLRAVFGDSAARRITADGRAAYRVVIDSVRRSRSARGRRAARVIDAFRFDSTSFAIVDIDGGPRVGFYVPGEGTSGGGLSLPLPHVRAPEPTWWSAVASTVPKLGADSSSEVWIGPRYDVIAHYDTSGEYATLVVRDSAKKEWPAGRLPTPTRRVYRLDATAVDTAARRGLARAFDESTLYSGSARTVIGPRRGRSQLMVTRWSRTASTPVHVTSQPALYRLARHQ